MKCPAFTSSRRHDEDIAMYFNKTLANGSLKKDDVEAATHCVLEREFHVLHTGQIFKAEHFSARNICSAENFMKNSNFCAGSKLIGPISDIQFGGGRDRDRDRQILERLSPVFDEDEDDDDDYDDEDDEFEEDIDFDPDDWEDSVLWEPDGDWDLDDEDWDDFVDDEEFEKLKGMLAT